MVKTALEYEHYLEMQNGFKVMGAIKILKEVEVDVSRINLVSEEFEPWAFVHVIMTELLNAFLIDPDEDENDGFDDYDISYMIPFPEEFMSEGIEAVDQHLPYSPAGIGYDHDQKCLVVIFDPQHILDVPEPIEVAELVVALWPYVGEKGGYQKE